MNQSQSSRSTKEHVYDILGGMSKTELGKRCIYFYKEWVTYALMAILNVREFGCCHTGESFDCISFSILRDVRHSPAIPHLQTGEMENNAYFIRIIGETSILRTKKHGIVHKALCAERRKYVILMLTSSGQMNLTQPRTGNKLCSTRLRSPRWQSESVGTVR